MIALINDIQDIIFDLPLETEVLHKIAKDHVLIAEETNILDSYYEEDGSLSMNGMQMYIAKFTELEIKNDEKRMLKVVRPNEIYKVITLLTENI